jgi:hypothetical protein
VNWTDTWKTVRHSSLSKQMGGCRIQSFFSEQDPIMTGTLIAHSSGKCSVDYRKKNKREAEEPNGLLEESRVECSCIRSVTPHGISYQRAAREPYNHTCGTLIGTASHRTAPRSSALGSAQRAGRSGHDSSEAASRRKQEAFCCVCALQSTRAA